MSCPEVSECICPNTECQNHQKCCACVVNHRGGANLPFCLRAKPEENKTASE